MRRRRDETVASEPPPVTDFGPKPVCRRGQDSGAPLPCGRCDLVHDFYDRVRSYRNELGPWRDSALDDRNQREILEAVHERQRLLPFGRFCYGAI